jgi:uncharacterized protein (DUF849 family)
MLEKRIITAAITGAVHTPTMSPYLPITPKEIADEAIRSWEAGAAAVHIHVRDPKSGKPTNNVELFRETISQIKDRSDLIIGITGGGDPFQSDEVRVRPIMELQPELASLDAGSMNYGAFLLAKKYDHWKYDWEKEFVEASEYTPLVFTYRFLKNYAKALKEINTVPEIEIFDSGFIQNTAYLANSGFIIHRPLWIQLIIGAIGGAPCSMEALIFMFNTAKQLLGDFHWSVIPITRNPYPYFAAALTMGAHLRVGMEDNLYIAHGELAKSNAQLVEKAAMLIREAGFEVATPEEARKIIGTKGRDKVNF